MKVNLLLTLTICAASFMSCKKENPVDVITETPMSASSRGGLGAAGDDIPVNATNLTNGSNFNGTAIDGDNIIWFNSHIKLASHDINTVVNYAGSVISFTAKGQVYTLIAPAAEISYKTGGTASYNYNQAENKYYIKVPINYTDNILLTALAYPVESAGLPGGIKPVNWSGAFWSNQPGISIAYQWSAAVYTSMTNGNQAINYNDMQISVTGTHPGVPVAFQSNVVGGARGGGGSNYTGSWSSTSNIITRD